MRCLVNLDVPYLHIPPAGTCLLTGLVTRGTLQAAGDISSKLEGPQTPEKGKKPFAALQITRSCTLHRCT